VPRVDIPVTEITRAGATPPSLVVADATNDHSFVNDGRYTFLEVQNVGASPQTVTFLVTPASFDSDLAIPDRAISVPNGATRYFGPFPKSVYDGPGADAGRVLVDVTSVDLRFRAWRLSTV
jgi:hypothetical protein